MQTIKSDIEQSQLQCQPKQCQKNGIILTFDDYDSAKQASDKIRAADLGFKLANSDKYNWDTLTTQEEKQIKRLGCRKQYSSFGKSS